VKHSSPLSKHSVNMSEEPETNQDPGRFQKRLARLKELRAHNQ
jgi:hypothetical protein